MMSAIGIKEQAKMCTDHNEEVGLYCTQCSTFLCYECLEEESDHESHKKITMKKYLNVTEQTVKDNIGKIKGIQSEILAAIETNKNNIIATKLLSMLKEEKMKDLNMRIDKIKSSFTKHTESEYTRDHVMKSVDKKATKWLKNIEENKKGKADNSEVINAEIKSLEFLEDIKMIQDEVAEELQKGPVLGYVY